MKKSLFISVLLSCCLMAVDASLAQQLADTSFSHHILRPAYPRGEGPVIRIDEAHYNFHTRDGRYLAFSRLLEQDGYRVERLDRIITGPEALEGCRILVIANPLHASNAASWTLPTPSAFSDEEIGIIKKWVQNGGSLLLIADHMPFAGAAYALGKAFGFEFLNGFAITSENSWPPSEFSRSNGTLAESAVTNGITGQERIDSVATFTGSAFKSPEGAIAVLNFLPENFSLQPDTAWIFHDNTPESHLGGFHQGALLNFGKGRVAVFGEAAMFTAQIANGIRKVGMNSEEAPQNAQFALNLLHWLSFLERYR